MCTPLIIAGLALTAGSMVTNSIASNQVENARNEVLQAESTRQQGFDQQIQQLNTQSQDRFVGFEPKIDDRSSQLADMFSAEVGDPNSATASIMPASSSDIVNTETDNQMGQAQGYVDQQSGALADMRAFGDVLGQTSLLQSRDASKIGQLGGFKVGSQNVVPYELDTAAKAGDGMKLFGDVLRMAGSTVTGAGINGGSIANMFGGSAGGSPAGGWFGLGTA